ncbi:MAG: type II CAAX endopeptidase family protein [Planctomycetota bacterium]|nr:type II CAAX endopeptidase family protein [Planctomycetota bacterium]
MGPPAPTPTGAPSSAAQLWAVLIAAPAPSLGLLAGLHLWPGPIGNALYMTGKATLYLTPLIWWKLVMRVPFPVARPPRGSLRSGLLLGLALAGLIVAVFVGYALPRADPEVLRAAAARSGFDTPLRYARFAVILCGANALLEEYAFRWFLYERCKALVGRTLGVFLGALIFTAHHVIVLAAYFEPPLVVLGSLGVFCGGVIWTWLYERRGSVWPGYVSHVLVDVALLGAGAWLLFR